MAQSFTTVNANTATELYPAGTVLSSVYVVNQGTVDAWVMAAPGAPDQGTIQSSGTKLKPGAATLLSVPNGFGVYASSNSTAYIRTELRNSHLQMLSGAKRVGYRLTVTGAPTGGNVVLTIKAKNGGTDETVNIAFNATAIGAQTSLVAAAAFANKTVFVTGGPLPTREMQIWFMGQWQHSIPVITASAASLTGGSSPTVTITTFDVDPIFDYDRPTPLNPMYLVDGATAPNVNSPSGSTTAAYTNYSIDGTGSVRLLSANSANAMTCDYYARGSLGAAAAGGWDMSKGTYGAYVYNPQDIPMNCAITFSRGETQTGNYLQVSGNVPPGWGYYRIDGLNYTGSTTTLDDANNYGFMEFYVHSYNNQNFYRADGFTEGALDGIERIEKDLPVVLLTYDDGLDSVRTDAAPIMRKYPKLFGKHQLGLVKDWVEAGTRIDARPYTGVTASTCMTLAQVKALINEGLVTTFNHTDKHQRFETGSNDSVNNTGTMSTDWVILWNQSNVPSGGDTFTLTVNGGTATSAQAYNVGAKALASAVQTAMNTDALAVTVVPHTDFSSVNLSTSFGLRLTFSQAVTLAIGTGAKFLCKRAFTVTDAVNSFNANKAYFEANGLHQGDMVCMPEGSYGANVHQAFQTAGITLNRLMNATLTNYVMPHALVARQPYSIPAINCGDLSTVNRELGRLITDGGVIALMFHFFGGSASGSNYMNNTEYDLLLKYLNDAHGRYLRVMTFTEYYEYLMKRFGSVNRSGAYGAP